MTPWLAVALVALCVCLILLWVNLRHLARLAAADRRDLRGRTTEILRRIECLEQLSSDSSLLVSWSRTVPIVDPSVLALTVERHLEQKINELAHALTPEEPETGVFLPTEADEAKLIQSLGRAEDRILGGRSRRPSSRRSAAWPRSLDRAPTPRPPSSGSR